MSKSWHSKGDPKVWRVIRLAILARDRYQCQIRIERLCLGKATEVHHTKGRGVTGDDPRYLVAACKPCNVSVGDPTKYRPARRTFKIVNDWQ